LLAGAVAFGCSGKTNSNPPAQTSGGASNGGKQNGTGGDTTPKGGATSAGGSGNASGGTSTSTGGGASALGGMSGTGNGGSSATAGSGGANTAGAPSLSEVTAAYCKTARTCCPSDSPLTDCETKAASIRPTASIQSGAVRIDATALSACVSAYQQAVDSCQEIPAFAACRKVFVGTRKPGESCTDSGAECSNEQGPSTCLITTSKGHEGVCKSNARGHSGDACLYTCRDGDTCGGVTYGAGDTELTICFESDGLYCDYDDNGNSSCKPIKKVGDACTVTDQCGSKAYCETTCKRIGMEGETCGMCRHDLTCNNGTCQSPTIKQANACDGYSLGP